MFLGAVTMAAAAGATAAAGNQEAFQFLMNGRMVGDAASHVLVFAIPLVARGGRPSWTVRLAAVSGFGMTLLFVVLSVFPLAEEQSPGCFAARMVGGGGRSGSLQDSGPLWVGLGKSWTVGRRSGSWQVDV